MSGERAPERPPDSWLLVRRYADARTAVNAYEAARDLLVDHELDASVLRMTVNGLSFVTVLGEEPLDGEASARMAVALGPGVEATLPEEVASEARRRRRAFKRTGAEFMERRTRRL